MPVTYLVASTAYAGGPLVVQTNGVPYKWSTATPAPYSIDGGSLGLWNNATAVANTVQAFDRWGPDLPTSALTFASAGGIPGDGDVNTAAEFLALDSGCDGISPVIFDANGSLFAALGLPSGYIGFAGPVCAEGGTITESLAAFNGKWFDGNPTNGELTEDEFEATFVHEFGHWLNLDHSQTNGHYFFSGETDPGFAAFGPPPLASVEIMFPFAIGGATIPQKDDVAAVSRMYPAPGFAATTGAITGTIRYPNGSTPFQGANVIARNVANPYYDAVSNVSGRPYDAPSTVGAYELPALADGASYAVEMVNVRSNFTGGSSVGPLDPPAVIPAPEEFYNGANEAAANPPDNVSAYAAVASTGGVVVSGTDIIMNGAQADLSLTKSDSPDPVAAGQNLVYTVTVVNSGPSTATAVTVTDTLPGGVTYVSGSVSGGSCSHASGTVTCGLGSMGNGASRTVTIVVTPTAAGTITNTASVLATEGDPNTTNNSASATTTVNPASADLSVTLNDFPDPVEVGSNLIYVATVVNQGPSAATGTTVTDVLPAAVSWVSATSSVGLCSEAAGTVTCVLGSLAGGASATVTITVTPTAASTVTNTVSVSANESDPAAGNNSAAATTTVVTALDNKLINISTRARVQTGDNVMIGGFYIGGADPKTVLIRARGGSLGGAPFNNPGVLANPTMQLYSGATVIAQNNDWQTTDPLCLSPATACGNAAQISGTGLDPCQPNPGQSVAPPGCAEESALLVTLAPGGYTAIVSGVGGTSGMGLVEVFEVGTSSSTLINISTRARVQTGDNVMIGGFYIGGADPKTVLIRARGGSLGGAPFNNPGVLANPTMQLYSGATVIAQNNDWQTTDPLCLSPATACGNAAQISGTGLDPCQPNPGQSVAPPGCAEESALLVTLAPGGYTAIVSGVGGTSGMGLVEVFEVP